MSNSNSGWHCPFLLCVHQSQIKQLQQTVFIRENSFGFGQSPELPIHYNQLYLAINDIDHTKTKAMSLQANGICERFHRTILQTFYQVAFRKKLYGELDALQSDLDECLAHYNNERTHQGEMCCGRMPMETLLDGKRIWSEKNLSQM